MPTSELGLRLRLEVEEVWAGDWNKLEWRPLLAPTGPDAELERKRNPSENLLLHFFNFPSFG